MSNTDESCLVFVESWGSLEGFRSGEGTDDEIVVRELVQNTLDAGADTVKFRIMHVPVDQIPGIEGYRAAITAIHPDLRQTSVAKATLEGIERALTAETVPCLLCTDNGSGLSITEYRRLLAEAMSSKVGEASVGKLGSVGVGHLTAVDASDLRYVLYASNGEHGPLFGGQAILASQLHQRDREQFHHVRQGCLTDAENVEGFRGYNALPANPANTPRWFPPPPP